MSERQIYIVAIAVVTLVLIGSCLVGIGIGDRVLECPPVGCPECPPVEQCTGLCIGWGVLAISLLLAFISGMFVALQFRRLEGVPK